MIKLLDSFEDIALTLAARIGPWLIPVLPAYTVGIALHKHLHTWPAVAFIGAIAFELAGIAATKTALRSWAWNNARTRKGDPIAPFGLTVFLSIIYFLVGIGLSVALEVWPVLTKFAPASFFLLAGQSYFVLAISHNLTKWENDKGQGKQNRLTEKELERLTQENAALSADNDNLTNQLQALRQRLDNLNEQSEQTNGQLSPALSKANAAKMTKKQARMTEALSLFNAGLSPAEVADNLQVSERTAKRYLSELNGMVTK